MDQFCVGEKEELGAGTNIVHVLATIQHGGLRTEDCCSRATKNVSNMGLTDQHDSCGVSMVA